MERDQIIYVYPNPKRETVLKPLTVDTAKAFFELVCQNKEHLSQFDDNIVSLYSSTEAVTKIIIDSNNTWKRPFCIWHQGQLVGAIVLCQTLGDEHEIGYWVAKEHCGKNIATNAVQAMTNHFYTSFGLWGDIIARTHKDNLPSQAVLHKAGFEHYFTNDYLWFFFRP